MAKLVIFEDRLQRRDFVSVHDVKVACRLALESDRAPEQVYDGMAEVLGCEQIAPEITGRHRVGAIRHCVADVAKAERELGYRPRVALEEGRRELAGWLGGPVVEDRAEQAQVELSRRGSTP
ncbi:MAG: hypothetical protein M5U28_34515 [Sandaracinaceae bacterium]|nr:hypothetical protein [Sandaracinaceae bacterium]